MPPIAPQTSLASAFSATAGAVALAALGIYMFACAYWPRLGASARWGRNGLGGPISPLGHVAWGLCAFNWAAICGSNALGWASATSPFILVFMTAAMGLLFFAGFRDTRAFRRSR